MSNDFHTSHTEISPELQGSILRGILESVTGMIVCILAMLLCLDYERTFKTQEQGDCQCF